MRRHAAGEVVADRAAVLGPVRHQHHHRLAERPGHRDAARAIAGGEVDLDAVHRAPDRGRHRRENNEPARTGGGVRHIAFRIDDHRLAIGVVHSDRIDRDERCGRQRHDALPRPGVEIDAPFLLDEQAARQRLNVDARRDDRRRQVRVLRRPVDTEMRLCLGERHRLQRRPGDESSGHASPLVREKRRPASPAGGAGQAPAFRQSLGTEGRLSSCRISAA